MAISETKSMQKWPWCSVKMSTEKNVHRWKNVHRNYVQVEKRLPVNSSYGHVVTRSCCHAVNL